MLYTSTDISLVDGAEAADSNTYQPFRTLNGAVMKGMASYMALIDTSEPEGMMRSRHSKVASLAISTLCAGRGIDQGVMLYVRYIKHSRWKGSRFIYDRY